MKLISLKLENYTCFLEELELKFGTGLNIVNAGNGNGKSKFLDSINWVISNKIFKGDDWVDSRHIDLYPLWYTNPDNIEHYKQDEITTSVELIFEAPDIDNDIDNNTTWTFTKKRFHSRHPDNSIKKNREELEIKYIDLDSGQTVVLSSYREADVIETLFPTAIRSFMWFQGEAFRDISLSHDSQEFNKILDTISHYPIYGKMVERAKLALNRKDKAINKLRQEQRGISKELQIKLHRKETLLKKVPELENQIGEIKADILSHEDLIAEFDNYLKNSLEYVKLDRDIKSKKGSIRSINISIEQYEVSKVNLLIKSWIIAGSKEHIENFQKKIDFLQEELNSVDETKIPLHIPGPELVQDMIDDMKCHICDRKIPDKDDDSYKALLKRLEIYKEGKKVKWLRKNFDDFKRIRKNALDSYSEIEESIKHHSKSIKSKIKERNNLMREKEALEQDLNKLGGAQKLGEAGSNYDLYFKRKKEKESTLRNLKLKLGNFEKNLNNYITESKQLTEEIKLFETDNKEINAGETSLKYYKVILDVLKNLESEAKITLEREITIESNDLFQIYYDNPGVSIAISDGAVQIYDRTTDEEIDLRSLNKSQQEMIKFSVINSLLKLSNEKLGNSLPLIADAPTSSSEWTNTKYFTDNVGKNFEQVVLFSKDYIEASKTNSKIKTELINLCKENGGTWYWCQKTDKNGNPVGRQFNNPKSDSESKTILTEKIVVEN